MRDLPWADVEPLPKLNGDLSPILDSVSALQRAWRTAVAENTDAFHEARRRSLRRHAIETGIIERLYDLDWGVTEALVAEGITADAVARAGETAVPDDVLALIRSQYEALEFLAQTARDDLDISISLVRQLHVALTRRQRTYTANGPGGIACQVTLHHGEWKQQPNHVIRSDGSRLEYTPPEQVAPQLERMVEFYRAASQENPIVVASWLHHAFVRIHPFEDGNGRVARCLTLLVLLRNNLAPLVVDRRERGRYLHCLDQANEGDLRPLVRFFAELEIVALRSELERPVEVDDNARAQGPLAALNARIDQLRTLRDRTDASTRAAIETLAMGIQQRLQSWFDEMATGIAASLRDGLDPEAWTKVDGAAPPDDRARYWRRQVIQAARSVDFFSNLHDGVWWTRLRVVAQGQELRYLVFLQKVGRGETGVLTLTVLAEVIGRDADDAAELAVVSTPTETVTWTYADEPDSLWENVTDVLDATLTGALLTFTSTFS